MPKRTPLLCTPDNCGDNFSRCGKVNTYRYHKCRCDTCAEAAREDQRKWREANPEKHREQARRQFHADPEKHRARRRARYAANPEKELAVGRAWRAENPEKAKESTRRWREANPEKVRDTYSKWARANRDKKVANQERYRANNPDMIQLQLDRRRARKQAAFVEDVARAVVFESVNYICQNCGVDCRGATWPASNAPTLDHIVPLSKGGTHEYANVQLLCFFCNTSKRDRLTG